MSDANADQTIQLDETRARYFLIWITKVSSTFVPILATTSRSTRSP